MEADITCWTRQGNRRATIEKATEDMSSCKNNIADLVMAHGFPDSEPGGEGTVGVMAFSSVDVLAWNSPSSILVGTNKIGAHPSHQYGDQIQTAGDLSPGSLAARELLESDSPAQCTVPIPRNTLAFRVTSPRREAFGNTSSAIPMVGKSGGPPTAPENKPVRDVQNGSSSSCHGLWKAAGKEEKHQRCNGFEVEFEPSAASNIASVPSVSVNLSSPPQRCELS